MYAWIDIGNPSRWHRLPFQTKYSGTPVPYYANETNDNRIPIHTTHRIAPLEVLTAAEDVSSRGLTKPYP